MKKIMKIISNPFARFGIGLLGVIAGGLLAAVFPPFAVIALVSVFLVLMAGESNRLLWFESDAKEQCPICGEETGVKLVRIRHYMYPFIPLPFILQLCQFLRIPYRSTYYKICAKCNETHVGENDFATIKAVAAGGLAHIEEITKQEFEALVIKDVN